MMMMTMMMMTVNKPVLVCKLKVVINKVIAYLTNNNSF